MAVQPSTYRVRRAPRTSTLVCAGAALGLALVLWGGYDRHWSWTGFAAKASLWDWLELVLLPVAVGVVPLWLRRGAPLRRWQRGLLLALGAGFAVLVVLGYTMDLRWTGFPGNRLWDWLELLVLPVVVMAWPLWTEIRRELRMHHRLGLALLAAGFVVAIVGGYALHWRWTGFVGNTLFDWINLLLLPLLVPTIVLPATVAWMRLEEHEERSHG